MLRFTTLFFNELCCRIDHGDPIFLTIIIVNFYNLVQISFVFFHTAHYLKYIYKSYWHYIQIPVNQPTKRLPPYTTDYSHNPPLQFKDAFTYSIPSLNH